MTLRRSIRSCFFTCLLLSQFLSVSQAADDTELKVQQLQQQLEQLQQQINALSTATPDTPHGDNELNISGFFDITLHTTDSHETPFDPGALELDIVYDKALNFAISSALVWTEDGAEVGVAFLDYHVYDHNIPVRGNLYEDPGFHLQLGRFDIPFASDYNFYAAPDRINITAPLTTDRILDGGLNSDGLRVYGAAASGLEYTLFWTNSLSEDSGSSLGSRIGYSMNDHFTLGASVLHDVDSEMHTRHRYLGVDINLHMGIAELGVEGIVLKSDGDMALGDGTPTGRAEESGYHVSLGIDLEPITLFLRYEEWKPEYSAVADPDNNSNGFNVGHLERLTLAGRYILHDYLYFKLEYFNYLGTETSEPEFDERKLLLQMVASF
ncbi:MAG: hypothetical protein EP315_07270 [Gammaproteobacteria bacterium]|nr:MAG: hypothetical protein EP315_07270 [Gammaproteobacteria bacterium]